MNNLKKLKIKHYTILIIIMIVLLGLNTYINRPSSDLDFETMILNADITMENISQEESIATELLERYMPRVYVAKDSYKPVDFYEQYVENSTLYSLDDKKTLIKTDVTKADLIENKDKKSYYLDYQVDYKSLLNSLEDSTEIPSKVYGRVYRSTLESEDASVSLLYLKYSFAYPYSGLPEGTTWWKKAGAGLLGNPMTWHELDIHGAIHIVLYEDTLEPVGVILAQHNHHRVYLNKMDLDWPEDQRLPIIVAKFSNEPYLLTDGKERYERVVGNPMDIEFLFGLTDKEPLTAGYDCVPKVEDTIEMDSELIQLPFDDPLYTSVMGLGDRKKILGVFRAWFMDGPPGMDFYAMPALLDLSNTLVFWYIDPEDETFKSLYESAELSFTNMDIEMLLDYQREKMVQNILEIIK